MDLNLANFRVNLLRLPTFLLGCSSKARGGASADFMSCIFFKQDGPQSKLGALC